MQTYKTIVVGTDLSAISEAAVLSAARMAAHFGVADVHLVHVVNTSPAWTVMPYSLDSQQMTKAEQHAEEVAVQRLKEAHHIPMSEARVHRHVRLGIPARELAAAAEELDADLLIIATHGYGALGRTVLGSVAGSVIRVAHCPVLVVAPDRQFEPETGNVLAAIDMSPVSESILRHAMGFASRGASKHLWVASFHEQPVVVPGDTGFLPRYVAPDELDGLARRHKEAVQTLVNRVREGKVEVDLEISTRAPASMCILERSTVLKPDLIVVGTSGRNAWKRMLLGSTATKVVADASCPVLVIPYDAEAAEPVIDATATPSA